VKTEARRGVLNGTPFFCGRKFQRFQRFQSFKVHNLRLAFETLKL